MLTLIDIADFPLPFRMELPQGWIEQTWTSGLIPPAQGREFRPTSDPKAILNVWYRGRGVLQHSAEAWRGLLEAPPHLLEPAEIESIRSGFGNIANSSMFELSGVKTAQVAGRSAVIVEGHWTVLNNDCYDAFLPVTDECTQLQEIYFVAPPDVYARNIDVVKATLDSIQWL